MMSIYVDETGMRKGDVLFLRLNKSEGNFHEAWRYFAFTRSLSVTHTLASRWYGRTDAPPDSPPCGFRGEHCTEAGSVVTLVLAIVCPIAILLMVAGASAVRWYLNRRKEHLSLWWCIDGRSFDPDSDHVKFVATGTPTNDEVLRQDILTKCQYKIRMYNGEAVWAEAIFPPVSLDAIRRNKQMLRCLAAIKHLHSPNVGVFHGIVTSSTYSYLVWEFGVHASLRMLLDTSYNSTSGDLLVSLIWDVLEGMDYIHSQELHYHGVPSSLTCMIDKRFCLQICGYGSARMLCLTTGRNIESEEDVTQLWMAPEMLADRRHIGSKAADAFSTALVILEIFTRSTPMDVILESESSCTHAIENLLTLRGPRIPIGYEVPKVLHDILNDCVSPHIRERPPLRHLMQKIEHLFPKKGFLDKILSRLQKYSEELEMKVAAQTQELFDEQLKVDTLLKQMIPPEFVNKLRNKEPVLTEAFDCVTLMFSDMPEFGGIVTKSSPLQLIFLLNSVYSTIDQLLESFDVYKVETINDSYMVVSGLPQRNGDQHVVEISRMALSLIEIRLVSPVDGAPLHLRIGIHSGPCVAGIVGIRTPRYCLFGDTINVASRMETNGEASRIHVSPSVKELLTVVGGFVLQSRGKITIKGKGEMETYWLLGRQSDHSTH
ncbi:hypothetical protein RvY_15806-2 [Ramazzottius varieornatus]|uniref:Guanylate cyclase n=1 Tax=Ramazzottius varieornatus TaxID=947166 RepID=A0A1D1VW80_RAMVA|nr:hypothetical protein RvY_15806-2 [Ramazzottius varieornatus]